VVYDQGLFIKTPDFKFVANYNYRINDTVSDSEYQRLGVADYHQFTSNCGETMMGFAFGKDGKI